ncbi:MAG TPA: FHA domain-containing protein [Candidatus Paceibacterota bacterium]|nr:FHA domain-containing protein [Candidatus Paceibacterota bacterium]
MIQLNILSGKTAGAQLAARRFPFRIGRAAGNDLQLEDDGVWERHLVLEFQKGEGFKLVTSANALATVNGEPVLEKILHNGDIVTIGSARLQFWLAAAQQRGLRLRENFGWALLIFVTLGQCILIHWLLR